MEPLIRETVVTACASGKRGLFPLCSEVHPDDRYTVRTLMDVIRSDVLVSVPTAYTGMNTGVLDSGGFLSVEHLVPVSVFRGGRASNAAFDAFNIMLETHDANALRGNIPFGNVSAGEANVVIQRSRMQTTLAAIPDTTMLKRGHMSDDAPATRVYISPSARLIGGGYSCPSKCRIEPLRTTRGAIARCVLFVCTAYAADMVSDWSSVLPTMATWDTECPVSEWEAQLHDAMARRNGYCNVFVMWRALNPDKPSLMSVEASGDTRRFLNAVPMTVAAALRRRRRHTPSLSPSPPPPPPPPPPPKKKKKRKRQRRRQKKLLPLVPKKAATASSPSPPKPQATCTIM